MAQNLVLYSLDDTRRLALTVGARLRCGDVVTLAGDLGAGKTTFAQYLIGSLSLEPVDVTSPTFNLLQTYPVKLGDGTAAELYHYDLYRIEHPSALTELGLEDAIEQVALIEWPERLGNARIPVALALSFTLGKDGGRSVAVDGDARWDNLMYTS